MIYFLQLFRQLYSGDHRVVPAPGLLKRLRNCMSTIAVPHNAVPRSSLTVPSWHVDTLLPTEPPSRLYLKSSCHGVLAFAELDEEMTVDELKRVVHERLMLPPGRIVHIASWGQDLDGPQRLSDLSLPTNARLEMKLAHTLPDPNRGLSRVRVTTTCLRTRRISADENTTVLELKELFQQALLKGEHEWWAADGTCTRLTGTTILATATLAADPKQETDAITLGQELLIENKGQLGGGKGTLSLRRVADGRLLQAVESSVTLLQLDPAKMKLQWMGRALADDEVLYALGVRTDDAIDLEFESPVTPNELIVMRSPAPEKKAKKDGGGGKKKKK